MAEKPKKYDLLIKNVRVVRPRKTAVEKMDIAVVDGKVAKLARGIPAAEAREVVVARGGEVMIEVTDLAARGSIEAP